MYGHVIKAHKSSYPDPVEFESNERLEVGAEDTEYPGWIWVRTRDGIEGWAPIETIEIIDGAKQGIAIANYCAGELDVDVGEKLRIHRTVCGWHFATNSLGENGWVPGECLVFPGKGLKPCF